MTRPIHEPIPVAPFLEWFDKRLAAIAADLNSLPQLGGVGNDHAPQLRLLHMLGWEQESGNRRIHRLRHENTTGTAGRAMIEDALDAAGVSFGDVYPDLVPVDAPVRDAYCRWCRRQVVVTDSGVCPWCDGVTVAERPRFSSDRSGSGRKMTDAQVRAAHAIYEQRGLSLREVAALIWERFGYATERSCATALLRAFTMLGLPRRHWRAASIAAHTTHGLRAEGQREAYRAFRRAERLAEHGPCTATHRDGSPCQFLAWPGTTVCGYHQPEALERRRAATRAQNDARFAALRHAC